MNNTAHSNARLLFCVPFRNIRNIPNSANPLNLFLFLSQISFGFRWKYHPSCLAQIKFVYVPSVKYLGEAGAQAVADQPMRSEIMPAKITLNYYCPIIMDCSPQCSNDIGLYY